MVTAPEQVEPLLLRLDRTERFKKSEIIGGALVMNSLRPAHGGTMYQLMTQLDRQLPADWRFASDVLTPFQVEVHEYCPDIAVIPRAEVERDIEICEPSWIAFVLEVISPETRDFDYGVKVGVYARAGIAECAVFDPYARSATRYAQPEDAEYTLRQVIHYGKPVSIVIETADLPVDPRD
jgi:Uma2 family endonuclease